MTTIATATAQTKLSDTRSSSCPEPAQPSERARHSRPHQGRRGRPCRRAAPRQWACRDNPAPGGPAGLQGRADGSRPPLVITDAVCRPLGIQSERKPEPAEEEASQSAHDNEAAPALSPAPPPNKQDMLIGMLKAAEARRWQEVFAVHGLLPPQAGAIAGALKKRLGLTVTSEPIDDRGRFTVSRADPPSRQVLLAPATAPRLPACAKVFVHVSAHDRGATFTARARMTVLTKNDASRARE